jgi:hypothetical protein
MCRAGLALGLLQHGDPRRAYEVARELIALGTATGNARALSLGHWCMALFWSIDPQCRMASARASIDAAKDPLYQCLGAVPLVQALLAEGRSTEVLDLCKQWLPYFETNGALYLATQLRPVYHAASIAQGRLSDGLRSLQAGIEEAKTKQLFGSALFGELNLMGVVVSVACGGARPPLGVLARNPWFVFTQAPFAARKAAALIDHLRTELPRRHQSGLLFYVDLYEAMLCSAQGKSARARECLQRVKKYLLDAGIEQVPSQVASLEAEIDARG